LFVVCRRIYLWSNAALLELLVKNENSDKKNQIFARKKLVQNLNKKINVLVKNNVWSKIYFFIRHLGQKSQNFR